MIIQCKHVRSFCIGLLFMLPQFVLSQSYLKLYDLGIEESAKGHYFNAAKLFTNAHKQEPEITMVSFYQAEALYNIHCYDEALHIFTAIAKDFPQDYPLSLYYKAEIELFFGKYSDALTSFAAFLKLHTNKDAFRESTDRDRLACNYALKHKDTQKIALSRLPAKSFNSEVNQYSLIEIDDSVLFYTVPLFTGDSASFTAKLHVNKHIFKYETLLSVVNALPADIASLTFSSDKNTAFFSACTFTNAATHCSIYETKYDSMEWSKPQLLPAIINEPNSSNAQPCFANIKGKQVLLFASNRAGGAGKYDIWSAEYANDAFSNITNIGTALNTEYDEITPFYDNTTQRLYFSSQMPHGFGGYDIFYSQLTADGTWSQAVNRGKPINSSGNDMYYSISENNRRAYLTSNRTATSIDGELYYFNGYFAYTLKQPESEKLPKDSTTKPATAVAQNKSALPVQNQAVAAETQLKSIYPLKIYFDHNQPSSGICDFDSLLNAYLSLKPQYAQNVKENTEPAVATFFANDVAGHFATLKQSLATMLDALQQGKRINISLRGSTSNAGGDTFNAVLAKNRVKLITNLILTFNNGAVANYLNNQLTITTLPAVLSSQSKEVQSPVSLQSAAQRYVEIMVQVVE